MKEGRRIGMRIRSRAGVDEEKKEVKKNKKKGMEWKKQKEYR